MVPDYGYEWPFIRGLFDSDGSVSTSHGRSVVFCGTNAQIDWVASFLGFGRKWTRKDGLAHLFVRKLEQEDLLDNLYTQGSLKLDRKYNNFFPDGQHSL